ncbi:MAG: response regulator [Thermodesulfobacteriota bacterium]
MEANLIKLLLVEDNPGDARLLKETLQDVETVKFDIFNVDNLKATIETLGLEDFDIVLLDLTLPDSQGLETLLKVRAEYPEIPIIVLTGLDDEQLALRALHQGAQDYLVKGKADTNLLLRSMRYGIERKKIERDTLRNQKLQSLETLAEGIAHDFNNMLSSILGNLSLAKVSLRPSNKIYSNLKLAEEAAFKAKDLTKQFLSLTKGGDPVKKATSISGSLKEYARAALGESNIMMQFAIEDDLWLVEVDQAQIGQAINNIVTDSKILLSKGGLINISANNLTIGANDPMTLTPGGKYIRIDIQSKILGMHNENVSQSVDPLSTIAQEGSGLRQATTHSIIERHGGYMDTDDDTGSGKTTSIYLPAIAEDKSAKPKKEEKLISGKGKVLVMEDDVLVRDTVIAMIKRLGYEVDFAGNAEETVEKYSKSLNNGHPFDAVLIDLTINGEIQGIEAIEQLKELNSDVIGILSTGYLNNPIINDFEEHGFSDLLHKPYDMKELSKALSRSIKE